MGIFNYLLLVIENGRVDWIFFTFRQLWSSFPDFAASTFSASKRQRGFFSCVRLTNVNVTERRSRDLGEVTQGKHGLSRLNIAPKSAFYYRKRLLEDRFLVKQPISMRINNRNVLGTLLHLPRFHSPRLPKLLVLIKRIVEILKVPT